MFLIRIIILSAVNDKGRRFGHRCCQRASPNSINVEANKKKFYINLLNLLNRFDGGIETNMHKAAHPSGSMGSSNPRRWRSKQLHHHVDGV